MNENLRSRFIQLTGIVIILLLLSPTPTNRVEMEILSNAKMAAMSGRPDAVLEYFESILEFYPNDNRYRISAAEIAFTIGDFNRALFHLDALEEDLDTRSDLLCIQAEALLGIHEHRKALEFWELADRHCPYFSQELRPLVDNLIQQENFEEAEFILNILSETQLSNADIHLLLGMVVATYAPEKALVSLRLADDLSDNENIQAQQLYREIEDARASDHPAYTLASVGQYFARNNNWNLAAQTFRNAITLQPDYAEAYAYLGLSLDQMEKNGITELLKAIELAPDGAIPHFYLGLHWLNRGDSDMALNEFESALELDPDNPGIIAQIGAAYEDSGEIETAIQAYRAAAEINPLDPNFWLLLAQVSLQNEFNISEVALPAARNALALNPNHAPSLDALGYSYFLLGDLNFAEKYISLAIQVDPSFAPTQYHLGLLKSQQEDTEAALAALELAYELDPDGGIGFLAKRSLETILP